MNNNEMHSELDRVEAYARCSKFRRFLKTPYKYTFAIVFREFLYKILKTHKVLRTKTFWGSMMQIALPASTDIYLSGAKTHRSEIQLARFLLNYLKAGDIFVDVGAHYGFYTLLASKIVGKNGKIFSFEPSPTTFSLLNKNTQNIGYIHVVNKALNNENGKVEFTDFPNQYSEYNTVYPHQFSSEKWYSTKTLPIDGVTLDSYLEKDIIPAMIKIDVEGAEYKVLQGAQYILKKYQPIVVIEVLSANRGQTEHLKAINFLNNLGYRPNRILENGDVSRISDVEEYMLEQKLESDNIVFIH